MPISYYTPPEILNFILFEEGESFDRDYLEVISDLKEAWQVDIWDSSALAPQWRSSGWVRQRLPPIDRTPKRTSHQVQLLA